MRNWLVLFLLISNCGHAQWQWPQPIVKGGLQDLGGLFTQPLKNPKKAAIYFGIGSSVIYGVSRLDEPINDWMVRQETTSLNQIEHYGLRPFGGGAYALTTMGSMFLIGQLSKNDFLVESSTVAAESFVIASLLVRIPKHLAHRSRPYHQLGSNNYTGPLAGQNSVAEMIQFIKKHDYTSFPSGHTTAAFAIASSIAYVAKKHNQPKWVAITAYSIAGLVGVSRIYSGDHWASDVVAGATFSIFVSQYLSKNHHWQINSFQ